MAAIEKGNIVNTERGQTGIVLAVRKDGTRALVWRYGMDVETWLPVGWLTVEVAGEEQCYKCAGSGLFYMGGMVLNGKYTGKTGPCYGCEGNGKQSDADRLRCHHYWHRKVEAGEEIESPMEPNPQGMLDTAPEEVKPEPPKGVSLARNRRRFPHSEEQEDAPAGWEPELVDCKGCGALHRDDVMCPW